MGDVIGVGVGTKVVGADVGVTVVGAEDVGEDGEDIGDGSADVVFVDGVTSTGVTSTGVTSADAGVGVVDGVDVSNGFVYVGVEAGDGVVDVGVDGGDGADVGAGVVGASDGAAV